MPMTYTTIATEATAVHRMCSPFERKGREGEEEGMMRVRKRIEGSSKYMGGLRSQRTFKARVGHVGNEKQLAVHINALERHEHFGANCRVQEKDDEDREFDCLCGARCGCEMSAR